jgi:hypothetical protein
MRSWHTPAVVAALVVAGLTTAPAASDRSAVNRGTAAPAAAIGARATVIQGMAWNADDSPIAGARVRLRNAVTGRIDAAAVANDAGRFTFQAVQGGTYVVELVRESGKVLAVGHPFTIAPGETVTTFVRLGTKVPWFSGFFNNAASAVASGAASGGIAAMAPVARPVSANK